VNDFAKNPGFSDGDVIRFKRGEIWTGDETLGHPIGGGSGAIAFGVSGLTFEDYGTGDKPIFDGNSQRPIFIEDASLRNLTIRNIDTSGDAWREEKGTNVVVRYVDGLSIDGVYMNGHAAKHYKAKAGIITLSCRGNIEIKNCTVLNCGPKDIPSFGKDYVGIGVSEISTGSVSIHDNTVHDCNSDCVYIYKTTAPVKVYNNDLYNGGENAIDCKSSSNITIHNNQLYREADFTGTGGSNIAGGSIVAIHEPIDVGGIRNVVVRDNRFTSNDKNGMNVVDILGGCEIYGNEFSAPGRGIALDDGCKGVKIHHNRFERIEGCISIGNPSHNAEVYNNIIIDPSIIEIPGKTYSTGGISENNASKNPSKIYNNSIYNGSGTCKQLISILSSQGTEIRNNVVYQALNEDGAYPLHVTRSGKPPIVENNLWYHAYRGHRVYYLTRAHSVADWATWVADHPGEKFDDPLFSNAPEGDLSLKRGSPCIDAGANLGSSFDDGFDPANASFPYNTSDQDSRGATWEIGAFVYSLKQMSKPMDFRIVGPSTQ